MEKTNKPSQQKLVALLPSLDLFSYIVDLCLLKSTALVIRPDQFRCLGEPKLRGDVFQLDGLAADACLDLKRLLNRYNTATIQNDQAGFIMAVRLSFGEQRERFESGGKIVF